MFNRISQVSRTFLFQKYFSISTTNMTEALEKSKINSCVAAVCNMRSTNNKVENLKQVTTIIQKAKEKSANFVFMPECCDFIGESRQETLDLSEPLHGPLVEEYKNLARNNKIWLSIGGVHELILNSEGEKSNKINNSHIVINDDGEIVDIYRKLHLFDVETSEFRFRESDIIDPGKELKPPIKTPIGNLGLLICYDVRFPEVSTILRKLGADVLTYPSAFQYSTGKAGHWESLLKARAIENQCFVIAAAQNGVHNNKRQSWGHGMIINPWGKVIAECNNELEFDVVTADINLEGLNKVRGSMPCFKHRRSDIYSLIPVGLQLNEASTNLHFSQHIINKKTIFYNTEHCFAFTNLRCVVPGHVLIATKRVVQRLKDLTPDEITDLFQCVVKVQRLLEPLYNCTSSTVTVQDGPEAGQTVRHVHFHVMPRKEGDFEHNDLIYIELNRHDHSDDSAVRTERERITEADFYRKLLNEFA